MKTILSTIIFLAVNSLGFAQIKLSGVTKENTTTSNKEVTFVRKEIDVTKVTQENVPVQNNIVIKNNIQNANVVNEDETVKVEFSPEKNQNTDNTKKTLIIDLNEAKQNPQVDEKNELTPANVVNVPTVVTEPVKTNTVVTSPVNTFENPKNTLVTSPTKVVEPTKTVEVNNANTAAPVKNEYQPVKYDENNYPEKKANNWAIGFNTGIPFVLGDIKSKLGYGGSVTVQKALGHVVSLRYQTFYGQVFGQDWKRSNDGDFKNYKTRLSDHSIQGVFTLNNINFYKREPKAIFNIITGVGFATRYSWTNSLDENGVRYNYSSVSMAATTSDRKDVLSAIREINDKGYETSVNNDKLEAHIKNTEINPAIILGISLEFKLSKKVDINLEHRVSWHNSDNLDAFKYNGNNDLLHYTSLGLNFKIGKSEESMWWMNPVYSAYDDINALKKKVDEGDLLKDVDKDGVADIFDRDLNTPENVPVDSRGIASDLDKDGVPDYKDLEPFTSLGAKVDKDGVAIDTDKDGIADVFDLDNNTPAGSVVDNKGRVITSSVPNNYAPTSAGNTSNTQQKDYLGIVLFNTNSSEIQKEYYPALYQVLSLTNSNPNAKILITGHADVRSSENYNLELSRERATAVYKMLTEVFKVPSSKLEIKYVGENNPLIPGLPDSSGSSYSAGHQMNRSVTFIVK